MENKLIDARVLGTDPAAEGGVLIELVMLPPVDWRSRDAGGQDICRRLRMRMVSDHDVPALAVECRFVRLVREHLDRIFPTYVLAFAPVLNGEEKDEDHYLNEDILNTLVHEAQLRGEDWTGDINRLQLFWEYRPDEVETVRNNAYRPPTRTRMALPPPTGDEAPLETLFAQFDAVCDAFEGPPPDPIAAEEDGIDLDLSDIEVVEIEAVVEQIRPEPTARLLVPPPPPASPRRGRTESFGYDVYLIHGPAFEPPEEFDLDKALQDAKSEEAA